MCCDVPLALGAILLRQFYIVYASIPLKNVNFGPNNGMICGWFTVYVHTVCSQRFVCLSRDVGFFCMVL